MPDINDYVKDMIQDKNMPRNEWEHAYFMIESEQKNNEYSKLVDVPVQLANIKDPRLMRLYQRDVILLTKMKSMSKRSMLFKGTCDLIYNEWRNEVLMSKANGDERKLQASTGGKFSPRGSLDGGLRPDPYIEMMEEEDNRTFMQKLMGSKK
jgi:hypothetical protein